MNELSIGEFLDRTATPQPTNTRESISSFLDQSEETERQIKSSIAVVGGVNPDEAARQKYLSKVTGLPVEFVKSDKGYAESLEKFQTIRTAAVSSPLLRAKLQNPDFLAVAQDDTPVLTQIADAVKYIVGAPGTKSSLAVDVADTVVGGAKVLGMGATAGLGKMIFNTAGGTADVLGYVTGSESLRNIGATWMEQAKRTGQAIDHFSPNDGWWNSSTGSAIKSGLQSAGSNLAMLPLGVSMSASRGVSAATNWVAGLMGVGAGTEAYSEARYAGKNPLQSLLYGIPVGAFEFAFEKIPTGKLFADLAAGKSTIQSMIGQVVPELWTEQLTTVAQDFTKWMNLNPEKTLSEFLKERPEAAYQTLVATLVGVGVQSGGVRMISKLSGADEEIRRKAESAQQAGEILKTISDLSAASKTRERDTETFQGFLQSATEDTDIERVYVTPAELQAAGISVDAIGKLAPSLVDSQEKIDKLQQDIEMGRDIEIPTAELMTNLPGSGLEQTLVPHLKTEAGGYSQTSATEYMKNHGAEVQAMVEKVMGEKSLDDTFKASADKVEQMVMEQLTAANRFTEDVNKPYAALWKAFFAVQAARLKTTPEQLFAQFNPKIVNAGQGAYDQNGRLITDSENFKRFFGDSKVVDAQGKPLVVYHGTDQPGIQTFAGFRGVAGHFAFDPEFASDFAFSAAEDNDSGSETVYPVYLSAQNVFDARNPEHRAAVGLKYQAGASFSYSDLEPLVRKMKEAGFDSYYDFEYVTELTSDVAPTGIAVFNPEQIKSAIGNNGNFDPNDANILRQDAVAEETDQDRANSLNDKRVSPRMPTAVKATEDPLADVRLQPDLATAMRDPAAFAHNIGLMAQYPNFSGLQGTPEQQAEQIIQQVMDNLIWLHDHWKPEYRNRSKMWYVGGNRIATRWADRFNTTPEKVAAVIAATSPQKDWFQNVSLAERILEAVVNNSDVPWDASMTDLVKRRDWGPKAVPDPSIYEGKTLKSMWEERGVEAFSDMAIWIRAWDEAKNPQVARVITPEGGFSSKFDAGKTGKPVALRWQSFPTIEKTLQVLMTTDVAGMSQIIGANHKVRSFYNNIIAPYAGDDVTIDTHAVAAGLLRPLGSSSTEVLHNFGSGVVGEGGPKNSAITGQIGTYAIYAEAYRRAAAQVGLLPREMQSITWEAVRGLFRPEQKNEKIKTEADRIWSAVSAGEKDAAAAREEISRLVGGIVDPAWVRFPAGADEARVDSSYSEELPGAGRSVGTSRPGNGTGNPASVQPGGVPNGVLNQDSVYNQSNWYFSALTSAITSLQTKASTAQGWKDAIKGMVNKGQVKADELEWTGINDWLDLQEGKVSKDSVLEYLAGNGVQVEEVTLASEESGMSLDAWLESWADSNTGKTAALIQEGASWDETLAEAKREGKTEVVNRITAKSMPSKYGNYTLPGGESYREVLLTLPSVDDPRIKKLLDEERYFVVDPERQAKIDKIKEAAGIQYRSSHWDQPNVLAHIRVNDRTDADGNKVLFVEEIQSDWGQDGKKNGFASATIEKYTPQVAPGERRALIRAIKEKAVEKLVAAGESESTARTAVEGMGNDLAARAAGMFDQYMDLLSREQNDTIAEQKAKSQVPAAPFVTKTEGWLNLALKRVITMAVEQGYDKVAFVNGEQSADRYDLSKQVKSLAYQSNEDGTYKVSADTGRGSEMVGESIPAEKLEDYVGKEVAQRIVDGSGESQQWMDGYGKRTDWKVMSGLDLKVGGEGMKTFYDKIVPNAVNAMLKKVGGGKLESVRVGAGAVEKSSDALGFDTSEIQFKRESNGMWSIEKNPESVVGGHRLYWDGNSFVSEEGAARLFSTKAEAEASVTAQYQPGFTITDAMREKVAGGLPLFQNQNQEPRGSFDPQSMTTTLLKAADLSTFLHESGHFFLEVMTKLADQSPEIKQDLETFFKWSGVESLDAWNAMSLDEKREHHENFARGFEAYLFTGKSPSVELQGMFQRFRAWLLNVYREIKNLNIRLTPEITGVFDRMLATAEQIQLAEDVRAYDAMYSTKPPGMSDEDWLVYQTQANDATQEAIDRLQARSLADMKWLSNAKGKMLRKLQAEAKARRDEVESEVTEEVMALPVEQARAWIRENARMTDEDKEALKDWQGRRDAAEERLKEEVKAELLAKPEAQGLKGLEKGQFVSRNRREMANEVERRLLAWEKENQKPARTAPDVDMDVVAQIIPGFTSGDHLAQVMAESPPAKELIEAMTDQRMLERYGDLNSQAAIERAAEEAIHNEARMRFVATEANALRKAVGQPGLMAKAVRDFAAQMIARSRIRDLNPSNYTSAEKRAGIAAKKAMDGGDLQAAAVQKRNQMINAYAAKAALEAREEMLKIVAYLQRFNKDGIYKTIDPGYVDQIHQLLERFDLRPSTSLRTVDKRIALSKWLEQQEEEGLVPDVPPELIEESQLVSYKNITVEELRGLRDTVKQIAHLGKLKNLLLTAKGKREYEAVRDLIVASINENAGGKTAENRTRPNTLDATIKLFKGYVLSHRKMASLAREIDGFKDAGPMWEYFIRTMNEAGDNEITMRAEATRKLAKIMAPLLNSGKMGGNGKHFPSINRSMNREEIISMALNMGNEGNIQRLLDGEGWSMEQIKPVLATLSKSDWEVVQKVWDFFEDYRPMIAAKERRVYGKEPQWIEAVPLQVVTSDGETINLRGGYYPIKYDTAMNERSEKNSEAEVAKQQLKGAFTSSTTRRSFTKNRAEKVVGSPLLYSFDGIFNGANEIIHDLSWHEWLIDANKLIGSKAIDNAIRNQYGADVVHQFKRAIQDIAAGESPAHDVMDKGLARLRTGAMVAGLGFNLVNSFINTIGLTQSMVRIGPKWVAQGIAKYAASPIDSTRMVREKSQFMASRAQTLNREVTEIQSLIRGKTKARAVMDRVIFLPLEITQAVVDTPTWIGAYEKALDEGHNEDRAVALADQAVLDSQSGGQTKDLALIQRGGQTRKLLTTFYGFFSSTYQLSVETGKQIKFKDPMSVVDGAAKFMLLWIIPSVLNTMLKSALSGDDDEPEELAKKLANDQISYIMSQMVGVREATGAIQKALGVSEFNVAYGGPAGYRFFQEIDKLGKQINQGEADLPLFKAADNVLGILFKYPSGQINKTVEGAAALYNGETDNPLALVVGHKKK